MPRPIDRTPGIPESDKKDICHFGGEGFAVFAQLANKNEIQIDIKAKIARGKTSPAVASFYLADY